MSPLSSPPNRRHRSHLDRLLGVKIVFSLVVLAVAISGYYFFQWLDQSSTLYLALFLGVFSIVSFWIFPEVTHKKN